jgi:hypothetical protein
MFKKKSHVLSTFLCALMLFTAVSAQTGEEYEPVSDSSLTGARLPAGALRVVPSSVPAEISQGLEKMVAAGEGKLVQGESEVLAFAGNGYTKAKAAGLMTQLENNLSAAGWKYEVGGKEGEVTVFSVLTERPARRAVVGYYVASDDGLVVAWTEVLSRDSNSSVENRTQPDDPVPPTTGKTSGNLRELVGKWEKKQSGMSSYQNGVYQGSSGNYESYTFYADGRVDYTSLIAVQNYGCRLEAFSQSKGRALASGSNLTISLGAGTIKRDDSCSASKNYTKPTNPTNFTYQWSIERDEYGTIQLCLTESNGSKYYYRRAE